MQFESFAFGSIRIDGITYKNDMVIDRGKVTKREKKPSKKFRDVFGHTPLSLEEQIPWSCRRLVIGTGMGALPVMDQVKHEAQRRKVELVIVPTARAIELLKGQPPDTNAILHVTCRPASNSGAVALYLSLWRAAPGSRSRPVPL